MVIFKIPKKSFFIYFSRQNGSQLSLENLRQVANISSKGSNLLGENQFSSNFNALSENSTLPTFLRNIVNGPLSRPTSVSPQRPGDFHNLSNEENDFMDGADYDDDVDTGDYDQEIDDYDGDPGEVQDLRVTINRSPSPSLSPSDCNDVTGNEMDTTSGRFSAMDKDDEHAEYREEEGEDDHDLEEDELNEKGYGGQTKLEGLDLGFKQSNASEERKVDK